MLDVGAGESPWKEWLPDRVLYHGIDVGYATEFGMTSDKSDITFYDGKIMPFPDSSYDSAICIEVLEHAQDYDLLLSEINRVLKSGAPFLLTIPWSARRHHIPYDYQRFTKEKLYLLFYKHNFVEVSIKERGNNIAVIANKLILLEMSLIKVKSIFSLLWTWPFALLLIPVVLMFVGVAHITILANFGDVDDPLGYSCEMKKAPSYSS
jgi:SAM-dependent methyltransferase